MGIHEATRNGHC